LDFESIRVNSCNSWRRLDHFLANPTTAPPHAKIFLAANASSFVPSNLDEALAIIRRLEQGLRIPADLLIGEYPLHWKETMKAA